MSGNGFSTLEGPVWINGTLYLSEYPGNPNPPPSRILAVTTSGMVTVAVSDSGSIGLAVDKTGTLYGAIAKDGSISKFDLSTGTRTAVVSSYNGARFNSPNDLAIRSDGTIYFSDPTYQAGSSQMPARVYRVPPGSSTALVVDATLNQPNGVTLSLDESSIYISSNSVLKKYPVMADGSTGTPAVFPLAPNANVNIDGMVIDCAGNLYGAVITSGTGASVIVLDPTGAQIGQIAVPGVFSATNVAFGGPDHKTLYITAQGSNVAQQGAQAQGLFQVTLNIPGMPY